jgi:hypothetical protein
MVMDRLKQIPRAQVVLHYHHCLLGAFRYLDFVRL